MSQPHVINPVDLLIVNSKRQILLARRAPSIDPLKAGHSWSTPGGLAMAGETLEGALRREIREELGCEILWLEYFRSYFVTLSRRRAARAVYFYGEIEGKVTLNAELTEARWFDFNEPELAHLTYPFWQRGVISDFLTFIAAKRQGSL